MTNRQLLLTPKLTWTKIKGWTVSQFLARKIKCIKKQRFHQIRFDCNRTKTCCSSVAASDLLLVYDSSHYKMFYLHPPTTGMMVKMPGHIHCWWENAALCSASLYTWHMERPWFPSHLKMQWNMLNIMNIFKYICRIKSTYLMLSSSAYFTTQHGMG